MFPANLHSHSSTLLRRAVADAHDLQRFLESRAYADDHVTDQTTRQAVKGAGLLLVVRPLDVELVALPLNANGLVKGPRELPFGAFDHNGVVLHVDLYAGRNRDWFSTDSRHNWLSHHQTTQRTSPPIFCFQAFLPVITPLDVETMVVPSPPKTRGISEWPE